MSLESQRNGGGGRRSVRQHAYQCGEAAARRKARVLVFFLIFGLLGFLIRACNSGYFFFVNGLWTFYLDFIIFLV